METSDLLFILLAAAFACLWIPEPRPRRTLSFGLLAAAGIPAIALGAVAWQGLIWAALLVVAGYHYHHRAPILRRTARVLLLGLVVALGFGVLPGFEGIPLYGPAVLKSGSAEYVLRINPGKVLAGFALLAFALPLTRDFPGWRRIGVKTHCVLPGKFCWQILQRNQRPRPGTTPPDNLKNSHDPAS